MKVELFDEWAKSYDRSIQDSEQKKTYPFYGYGLIQQYIYNETANCKYSHILEMGIGTGMMSKRLYDEGYKVTGVDFSKKMLEKAKSIMPNNTYFNTDFLSFISKLETEKYDVIIFSYSIHHLEPKKQEYLLNELGQHLSKKGIIIIGDVMTNTISDMLTLSKQNQRIWDDEEFYPINETYQNSLISKTYNIDYHQMTFCSGVMKLTKKEA